MYVFRGYINRGSRFGVQPFDPIESSIPFLGMRHPTVSPTSPCGTARSQPSVRISPRVGAQPIPGSPLCSSMCGTAQESARRGVVTKDYVHVMCRFKPESTTEKRAVDQAGASTAPLMDVTVDAGRDTVTVAHADGEKSNTFTFDDVFAPDANQSAIYDTCGIAVVNSVISGINSTIFAYGQTGSGKTHTMLGPTSQTPDSSLRGENRGLTPRCLEALFHEVDALVKSPMEDGATRQVVVRVSYVEIYMERVRDLLAADTPASPVTGSSTAPSGSLQIYDDRFGTRVAGAKEHFINDADEALALLKKGGRLRVTSSTAMNDVSNRSHSIFVVSVEQRISRRRPTVVDEVIHSRLNMVDLAGSEKVSKTNAEGLQLEEANKINQSLLYLGMVIRRLTEGGPATPVSSPRAGSTMKPHVPYLNSKLTRLLMDSLGGNSLTYIVLTCSISSCNADETLSTLRFGERAKLIRNAPKVNRVVNDVEEMKMLLESARREIVRLSTALLMYSKNAAAPSASTVGGASVEFDGNGASDYSAAAVAAVGSLPSDGQQQGVEWETAYVSSLASMPTSSPGGHRMSSRTEDSAFEQRLSMDVTSPGGVPPLNFNLVNGSPQRSGGRRMASGPTTPPSSKRSLSDSAKKQPWGLSLGSSRKLPKGKQAKGESSLTIGDSLRQASQGDKVRVALERRTAQVVTLENEVAALRAQNTQLRRREEVLHGKLVSASTTPALSPRSVSNRGVSGQESPVPQNGEHHQEQGRSSHGSVEEATAGIDIVDYSSTLPWNEKEKTGDGTGSAAKEGEHARFIDSSAGEGESATTNLTVLHRRVDKTIADAMAKYGTLENLQKPTMSSNVEVLNRAMSANSKTIHSTVRAVQHAGAAGVTLSPRSTMAIQDVKAVVDVYQGVIAALLERHRETAKSYKAHIRALEDQFETMKRHSEMWQELGSGDHQRIFGTGTGGTTDPASGQQLSAVSAAGHGSRSLVIESSFASAGSHAEETVAELEAIIAEMKEKDTHLRAQVLRNEVQHAEETRELQQQVEDLNGKIATMRHTIRQQQVELSKLRMSAAMPIGEGESNDG